VYEWETSVVLVRNREAEILLVQQNYGYRFFGLPGGKVEAGEDPRSAAIRELYEETGLRAASVTSIGQHDLIYPGSGARYRAHAFSCASVTGQLGVRIPDEISSVGWFGLTRLPAPLTPSATAVLAATGAAHLASAESQPQRP
jgi:8-oxo-dGTP pyrophosphatase MutT (NUDIX family)